MNPTDVNSHVKEHKETLYYEDDKQIKESDIEAVYRAINRYGANKNSLIAMLLDVQNNQGYLSKEAMRKVAFELGIREIDVFSVATFYKVFSLKPRGRHIISVCMGTACHVRGGVRVVDEIQRELNIKDGETTEDMEFTLETVRCLGACALGPVVVVDDEYHGQMNTKKIKKLYLAFSTREFRTT